MSDVENSASISENDNQDRILADILRKLTQGNASEPPHQAPTNTAGSADILSSLLSSDILSKLPQLISTFKPILELMGNAPPHQANQAPPPSATPLPAHPAATARSKTEADRSALLCAMKPYLSRDRQNAIDYIIKLSRLGDILKTL